MKKIFLSILSVLVLLFSSLLFSCSSEQSNASFYLDSTNTILDGISYSFSCSEYYAHPLQNSENKELKINFAIKNNKKQPKDFSISNAIIKHEESGAQFKTQISPINVFTLEYGIDNFFTISATIPKSYLQTKYSLFLETEDLKLTLFLYETPDELRKDCIVQYSINNNIVYTTTIKEGRPLTSDYVWENPDHLHHCKTWYLDEDLTTKSYSYNKIYQNITLYGEEVENLEYHLNWLKNILHTPSDGIIVVASIESINISSSVFYSNDLIKEIYLPESILEFYPPNFSKLPNLEKIHFAGSQTTWESFPVASKVPTNIIVVFNSTFG